MMPRIYLGAAKKSKHLWKLHRYPRRVDRVVFQTRLFGRWRRLRDSTPHFGRPRCVEAPESSRCVSSPMGVDSLAMDGDCQIAMEIAMEIGHQQAKIAINFTKCWEMVPSPWPWWPWWQPTRESEQDPWQVVWLRPAGLRSSMVFPCLPTCYMLEMRHKHVTNASNVSWVFWENHGTSMQLQLYPGYTRMPHGALSRSIRSCLQISINHSIATCK